MRACVSEPACPAALAIDGAVAPNCGVVCRVMQREHEQDAGLGMSAAASGFIQHDATGGVFLTVKSDPSTVEKFCHGAALPVLDEDDVEGGRASYTYCPTWQAEKARIAEGRSELVVDAEPEAVAAGMAADSASDPWAAARGLEELTA